MMILTLFPEKYNVKSQIGAVRRRYGPGYGGYEESDIITLHPTIRML